jgi:hypothetical protein
MTIKNGVLECCKSELIDVLYHEPNPNPDNDFFRLATVGYLINNQFPNATILKWLVSKTNLILRTNDEYRESSGLSVPVVITNIRIL